MYTVYSSTIEIFKRLCANYKMGEVQSHEFGELHHSLLSTLKKNTCQDGTPNKNRASGNKPQVVGVEGRKPDTSPRPPPRSQSLSDLVAGKLDFFKTLADAKRPMLILGEAALSRPDGATLFNLALELASKTGMIVDSWNGFNLLHQAAGRVAGLDIGFLPGEGGLAADKIVKAANSGDVETVFLLGVDEMDLSAFGDACLIYIGSHGDHGASRADVILPAAA